LRIIRRRLGDTVGVHEFHHCQSSTCINSV
jgi:hypothetical protein